MILSCVYHMNLNAFDDDLRNVGLVCVDVDRQVNARYRHHHRHHLVDPLVIGYVVIDCDVRPVTGDVRAAVFDVWAALVIWYVVALMVNHDARPCAVPFHALYD